MCALDSNLIAAIGVVIAAIAVVAATIVGVWQARFTTRVQTLFQCDNTWSSTAMRKTRHKAATSLLAKNPTVDVDRVLDFFETIAGIFVKRRGPLRLRVIPDDWARHTFYWYTVCYWCKCRDYIGEVQQRETERDAWKDLCALMPKWIEAEGGAPTEKDIDDFLRSEYDISLFPIG